MNGIECSYDTSSAEVNQVFGKCFNPLDGQLQKVFSKVQKNNGYYSQDLAKFNVAMINDMWERMKEMPLPDYGFIPGMRDDANDRVMPKEHRSVWTNGYNS